MNFVSPKVACISINLLSSLPLNTVMSGLVLQVITCISWMSYRNGYLVLAARWTLVIVARYLELLARYRNVASLSLLLVFLWKMFIWIVSSYSRWNYIRYSNKFHDLLSPFLDAIRMSLSTLFFLVQPGSGNSFFLALKKKLYFPQCRSGKSFWFCSSWSYLVELEKSWPWRMDCSICASHVQEQPKQSNSWWELHL